MNVIWDAGEECFLLEREYKKETENRKYLLWKKLIWTYQKKRYENISQTAYCIINVKLWRYLQLCW